MLATFDILLRRQGAGQGESSWSSGLEREKGGEREARDEKVCMNHRISESERVAWAI